MNKHHGRWLLAVMSFGSEKTIHYWVLWTLITFQIEQIEPKMMFSLNLSIQSIAIKHNWFQITADLNIATTKTGQWFVYWGACESLWWCISVWFKKSCIKIIFMAMKSRKPHLIGLGLHGHHCIHRHHQYHHCHACQHRGAQILNRDTHTE